MRKKNQDGFEQLVVQLLSKGISKEFCLYVHLAFEQIRKNDICLINVDVSPKEAYVQEGNEIKFFLCTGTSTQQLNIKELNEYISTVG
ncbi:MAG: hypothetical protein B6245_00355 [Desulfobacteraceae bacterium 4572_88]|nr:MAG: hypothetical protein B6245_00355 [Desulfobacteraceae bacterium 4572_88]